MLGQDIIYRRQYFQSVGGFKTPNKADQVLQAVMLPRIEIFFQVLFNLLVAAVIELKCFKRPCALLLQAIEVNAVKGSRNNNLPIYSRSFARWRPRHSVCGVDCCQASP